MDRRRKEKGEKKPRFGVIAKVRSIKKIILSPISIYALIYLTFGFITRKFTIFTPDFGQSDAYHLNFSYAKFLSDNLRKGHLPLWTDALQGGISLIAEGQAGLFFLPNLFFLKFFPFEIGYNLLFLLDFFLLSLGMYLLLREFRVKAFLAFLLGLNFPFFSVFSLRLVHLNLHQGIALLPLAMFFFQKTLTSNKIRYYLFFFITISQSLLVGHLQAPYLIILNLLLFLILKFLIARKKREFLYRSIIIALVVLSAIIFVSFRFVEVVAYLKHSFRGANVGFEVATAYPFRWENLLTLWNPYIFGNPKEATYPIYSKSWGIFWENTFYFGKIFFTLIICAVFFGFKRLRRKDETAIFVLLSLFYILLALGKYSPIYFLYNFPPFSSFRVPGRYLVLAAFNLTIFVGIVLSSVVRRKAMEYLLSVVLLLNFLDISSFTWIYHQKATFTELVSRPKIVKFMDRDYRYITLGQVREWNKVFLTEGWGNKETKDKYLFFKNFLYPNSNLMYGLKTLQFNGGGIRIKRSDYVVGLILRALSDKNCTGLKWLAERYYVKYFISAYKLSCKELKQIQVFQQKGSRIFLYGLEIAGNPDYYFPLFLKKVKYREEIENFLKSEDILATSLIEDGVESYEFNRKGKEVKVIKARDDYIKLRVKTEFPTFIIIRRSFLPGWKYFLNGKEVRPKKSDLLFSGFYLPQGEHIIVGSYSPLGRKFLFPSLFLSLSVLFIGVFLYKSESFRSLKS